MSKKSAELSRTQRARAEIERQQAADRRRTWVIGGVIALLVLVAVGVGYALTSSNDETGKATADVPGGLSGDWTITVGDESAPTTVTIYEDPQCPICAQFEALSGDQLEKAVEDGRVKVDYRIVSFLDPHSANAYSSRAANALYVVNETSGADVFKAFHDLLYQRQPDEDTAGPDNATLVDWAVEAGADRAAVTQGIEDDVYHQYVVDTADQMSKDGVSGTPTVFIDGKVVGQGNPQEALQALLDKLKETESSGSTG
jgi:protein-disulfide isomerase